MDANIKIQCKLIADGPPCCLYVDLELCNLFISDVAEEEQEELK